MALSVFIFCLLSLFGLEVPLLDLLWKCDLVSRDYVWSTTAFHSSVWVQGCWNSPSRKGLRLPNELASVWLFFSFLLVLPFARLLLLGCFLRSAGLLAIAPLARILLRSFSLALFFWLIISPWHYYFFSLAASSVFIFFLVFFFNYLISAFNATPSLWSQLFFYWDLLAPLFFSSSLWYLVCPFFFLNLTLLYCRLYSLVKYLLQLYILLFFFRLKIVPNNFFNNTGAESNTEIRDIHVYKLFKHWLFLFLWHLCHFLLFLLLLLLRLFASLLLLRFLGVGFPFFFEHQFIQLGILRSLVNLKIYLSANQLG